ncbi:MAG: hypothetical protein IJ759_00995 [Bacteroidales bacterium]|nr:hypothetical protein [Bacteroidales bacterium]
MKELIRSENRYQVKFNDETGFCKLLNGGQTVKEFVGVSEMLNYCTSHKIDVAIENCICSTVKNY